MIIGVTGHRPERLRTHWCYVSKWLDEKMEEYKKAGPATLLTGMARGTDQIAAISAINKGVGIRCYFPFVHRFTDLENYIVDHAEAVRYEADGYRPDVYKTRDCRIVDDCDVLLVVWDGVKMGGTYYTYKYALAQGKKVEVLRLPPV